MTIFFKLKKQLCNPRESCRAGFSPLGGGMSLVFLDWPIRNVMLLIFFFRNSSFNWVPPLPSVQSDAGTRETSRKTNTAICLGLSSLETYSFAPNRMNYLRDNKTENKLLLKTSNYSAMEILLVPLSQCCIGFHRIAVRPALLFRNWMSRVGEKYVGLVNGGK